MFHCPSLDDIHRAALALLPRGRAWQTAEAGPRPGTVIYAFWRAVADLAAFLSQRLCALREELWCASEVETHDLWLAEYGLPDACDPFPDLCVKVAALGGADCDYYREIAARAGWEIRCRDMSPCGAQPGRRAVAGCAMPGAMRGGRVVIDVDLGESPAYAERFRRPPKAGRLQAGMPLACPPDISALVCLLTRAIHAHVLVEYRPIAPATYLMASATTHLATETGELLVTE